MDGGEGSTRGEFSDRMNRMNKMPSGSGRSTLVILSKTASNVLRSALLDARVGVVVVNALEVLRLDLVPRDIRMRVELHHHRPDQVLHENGTQIGAFGDRLLVTALEQGV